jgi:hypothetical protein
VNLKFADENNSKVKSSVKHPCIVGNFLCHLLEIGYTRLRQATPRLHRAKVLPRSTLCRRPTTGRSVILSGVGQTQGEFKQLLPSLLYWGGYPMKISLLAFSWYNFDFERQKYPGAQNEIKIEQSQHYPVQIWEPVEINI